MYAKSVYMRDADVLILINIHITTLQHIMDYIFFRFVFLHTFSCTGIHCLFDKNGGDKKKKRKNSDFSVICFIIIIIISLYTHRIV